MNYEFKIIAFTDDPDFSISLTRECSRYGFSLSFVDLESDLIDEIDDESISVILLDINHYKKNPFKLCESIKITYGVPVFGLLDKFNKEVQEKSKKTGFDLIFTKKMLLRSIKEVVIHVSNEE
tara:strand:- start:271 stop:639 length:369 start_codon:yes stop_codon:yes gene_type:complete